MEQKPLKGTNFTVRKENEIENHNHSKGNWGLRREEEGGLRRKTEVPRADSQLP